MAVSPVNVFRFDYETSDKSWTAYIAAYTSEEAMAFLKKNVPGIIKINSTGEEARIDALTDRVRELIVGQTGEVGQETTKSDDELKWICPWCQKECATANALKGHITKMHKKD